MYGLTDNIVAGPAGQTTAGPAGSFMAGPAGSVTPAPAGHTPVYPVTATIPYIGAGYVPIDTTPARIPYAAAAGGGMHYTTGSTNAPIPGPSAFATLVSVSGFGGRGLLFDGFPSPKASRRRARLSALLVREEAFMLYESPFRIAKLMADIAGIAPERQVCIGRELTKIHEQVVVGSAAELAARISGGAGLPIPEKGEFAVLVAGRSGAPAEEEGSAGGLSGE